MSTTRWAPNLPEDWGVASLRWVAEIFAGGTPDKSNLDFWTAGTIPWLNSGSVNDWSISKPSALITEDAYASSSAKWIPPKSVVIALAGQGKTKGLAARIEFECTCNQSMAAIVPGPKLDYRFLHYWLTSNYQNIRNMAGGDKRDGLNLVHIGSIDIPLPLRQTQRAIADFLDRETSRIDTLIAEQERLIALMSERRQSYIESAAVGLTDPTVARKPCDLTWVDSVPEHWTVANIRRFASMKSGHTPSRSKPEYWNDCSIPWFTLADVWQIRDGKRTYLKETAGKINELGLSHSAAELLPVGTVVLSRTASVGFSGIMAVEMATSQDFWNWVPDKALDSRYLMWVLRAMKREFHRLMTGSTHKTIYQHTAAAIRIPVPPINEQMSIVQAIDAQTSKIDTLISETEKFIELSRERRAALITAAVTGQIDVREEVA